MVIGHVVDFLGEYRPRLVNQDFGDLKDWGMGRFTVATMGNVNLIQLTLYP
jgi:hypothetical protein